MNQHRECHKTQEYLAEISRQNPDLPDKYHPFSGIEMVDYYCASIVAPDLSGAIGTVKTNAHLKRDFEAAQGHVTEMIRHNKISQARNDRLPSRYVAATGVDHQVCRLPDSKYDHRGLYDGKWDHELKNVPVKENGYSPAEYKKLPPTIKRANYLYRARKGQQGGGGKPQAKAKGKRKIAALEGELAEAKKQLEEAKQRSGASPSEVSSTPGKGAGEDKSSHPLVRNSLKNRT